MNVGIAAPFPPSQSIFRNSRILVGFVMLIGVVTLLAAPCLLLVALTEIFTNGRFGFNSLLSTVSWLVFAIFAFLLGWRLCRLSLAMSHNAVLFDGRGMRFLLKGQKGGQGEVVGWHEVKDIYRQRTGNDVLHTIRTTDGRLIAFSSFTFFRAKALAKRISAISGQPIQRLK